MSESSLIESFRQAGQGHVFAFLDDLSPSERQSLLAQAAEVDLAELARLQETLLGEHGGAAVDLEGLEPAPYEPLPSNGGDALSWERARAAGEEALRAGRVAAFTVAGGQGTRLGYDGPKGTFPVTPVKSKPLFQVFAEKIRAAGRRYGVTPRWLVMTSHQNHEATTAFFDENKYFGLDSGRVTFFRQGRMPAVDFNGRILMESRSSLALAADGHGGSLRALDRSGALDLLEGEGVDTLSYFQVDNPLVACVDPAFIGWHLRGGSEMSSKMLPKAHAEEKLGHFCLQRGRLVVVEYSDLPLEMQREAGEDGQLRFRAGSIAIHLLSREFVRRVARGGDPLPFHRADKKIAAINERGEVVKPEAPNGVKFEMFVFDALPLARSPLVIETSREDDFAPVKNASGPDSPQTCRDAQLRLFARWANAAGAGIPVDETGLPPFAFEVSPLFATDAASFAESWRRLRPKPAIERGTYLE